MSLEINSFLLQFKSNFDSKTFNFLRADPNARIPIFYLLPKIHKPNIPGRPIISGCGSPTDNLSAFVDYHIKPLVKSLPAYIKDTNHFLNLIFSIPTPLPKDTLLATIDVKSLYTNIPIDEGVSASLDGLMDLRGDDWPLLPIIYQLMIFILKHNYFVFRDEFYLQKHGTAMGTKMAPSFANIFMGALEGSFFDSIPVAMLPYSWKRFIDDIFLIWLHGGKSFVRFMQLLNSFHPTIKFEFTHSKEQVNFLDTTIYITQDGHLESDLYIKPTGCLPLLHNSSHHPASCRRGLVCSQFIRYRRLITNDQRFRERVQMLRATLLARGYRDADILQAIAKASSYTQADLLEPKTPEEKSITPFIIPYNFDITHFSTILRQHWSLIKNDPDLSGLFHEPPIVAFQKHPNLKDIFVRTKFH